MPARKLQPAPFASATRTTFPRRAFAVLNASWRASVTSAFAAQRIRVVSRAPPSTSADRAVEGDNMPRATASSDTAKPRFMTSVSMLALCKSVILLLGPQHRPTHADGAELQGSAARRAPVPWAQMARTRAGNLRRRSVAPTTGLLPASRRQAAAAPSDAGAANPSYLPAAIRFKKSAGCRRFATRKSRYLDADLLRC